MLLKELFNRAQIIHTEIFRPFYFARTSCLLYLYTNSDCRMTRTSCLLYLPTHSDCRISKVK